MTCDNADGKTFNMHQTRRNFFPFNLCMEKDSKQMFQDEFGAAFDLLNESSKDGQTVYSDRKPLNSSMPADMAAIQKALGKSVYFFVIVVHSPCVSLLPHMRETNSV